MERQHTDVPVWRLSRYGDDEQRRRRLTWRHVVPCMLALGIGVYGGLLLAAAWFAR